MLTKRVLLLCCLILPAISSASNDDHEAAKKLKEAGQIVPLEQLLLDVRTRHSGRVLEVELETKRDQHVYEIEMVDDNGKVREYFYDAANGHLLWEEDEDGEKSK